MFRPERNGGGTGDKDVDDSRGDAKMMLSSRREYDEAAGSLSTNTAASHLPPAGSFIFHRVMKTSATASLAPHLAAAFRIFLSELPEWMEDGGRPVPAARADPQLNQDGAGDVKEMAICWSFSVRRPFRLPSSVFRLS